MLRLFLPYYFFFFLVPASVVAQKVISIKVDGSINPVSADFIRNSIEKTKKEKGETPEHFKSSDKAPYLIPYRSQNAFIQIDPQLFKFADTMRSRQEGLRRRMDIPASVTATIEGGGFPRLLEKRDTRGLPKKLKQPLRRFEQPI